MRVTSLLHALSELLDRPRKVLLLCSALLVIGLIFDGTLYRLYGFYLQEDRLRAQIGATEKELEDLRRQVSESRAPQFLERLARERFNMVGEDELIFIFDE